MNEKCCQAEEEEEARNKDEFRPKLLAKRKNKALANITSTRDLWLNNYTTFA